MIKQIFISLIHGDLLSTALRKFVNLFNLGSLEFRIECGAFSRSHYMYCIYNSAKLAKALGLKKISVIEFGCAGGKGLIKLEKYAQLVEKSLQIEIEIYGFDTGEGLPEPKDYKDLPYHWKSGFFKMDKTKLDVKLQRSKLILGNVEDTVQDFISKVGPAPIGAIMHDLDFYSSTIDSFKLFKGGSEHFLPRVYNYFDDIIGSEIELYNDYTGERLAIEEFNSANPEIKFSHAHHLISRSRKGLVWHHQIRILHFLKHHQYNNFISYEDQQL
jgi:hypothetical protein|tara:strand:- start:292 stop:1107 length:816 start_codon:yes stop_codon:yes gene_type:complete